MYEDYAYSEDDYYEVNNAETIQSYKHPNVPGITFQGNWTEIDQTFTVSEYSSLLKVMDSGVVISFPPMSRCRFPEVRDHSSSTWYASDPEYPVGTVAIARLEEYGITEIVVRTSDTADNTSRWKYVNTETYELLDMEGNVEVLKVLYTPSA